MNNHIGIGLVGLGTVGGAVARLIQEKKGIWKNRYNIDVELKRVGVADLGKPRFLANEMLVKGFSDVITDPGVDVVVELVGGVELPKKLIIAAMKTGKHVISANKALIAECGDELLEIAHDCGVQLRFEASVCGGIPIIKVIRESLGVNRIKSLTGIINGTTNYILTRMTEAGVSFENALTEAKEQGFAEADPTLDVDGTDAIQKMSILSSLAFDGWCYYKDAMWEGIESITSKDVEFAKMSGFVFKLVAMGRLVDDAVSVTVFPALVGKDHQLSNVNNEFNAVMIDSDFLGSSVLIGPGAGGEPTASSVAADITDLISGAVFVSQVTVPKRIVDPGVLTFRYLFHLVTENRPGIWARVTGLLAEHGINIESVHQNWEDQLQASDLYVLVDPVREDRAQSALAAVRAAKGIFPESRFYRIIPS